MEATRPSAISAELFKASDMPEYAFLSHSFPAIRISNPNFCSLIATVGIYKLESLMRSVVSPEVLDSFCGNLKSRIPNDSQLSTTLNWLMDLKRSSQDSNPRIESLINNPVPLSEYCELLKKLTIYEMTKFWNKTTFKARHSMKEAQSIVLRSNDLKKFVIPFLE